MRLGKSHDTPVYKAGGYSGYSLQDVWEKYVDALRGHDTKGALLWYHEFLMKGGDRHAADVAMGTDARGAPRRAPMPMRESTGNILVDAMGGLLDEAGFFRKLFPGLAQSDVEKEMTMDQRPIFRALVGAVRAYRSAMASGDGSKRAAKAKKAARIGLRVAKKDAERVGLGDLLGQPQFSIEDVEK
jgi:hypothetical protein